MNLPRHRSISCGPRLRRDGWVSPDSYIMGASDHTIFAPTQYSSYITGDMTPPPADLVQVGREGFTLIDEMYNRRRHRMFPPPPPLPPTIQPDEHLLRRQNCLYHRTEAPLVTQMVPSHQDHVILNYYPEPRFDTPQPLLQRGHETGAMDCSRAAMTFRDT